MSGSRDLSEFEIATSLINDMSARLAAFSGAIRHAFSFFRRSAYAVRISRFAAARAVSAAVWGKSTIKPVFENEIPFYHNPLR